MGALEARRPPRGLGRVPAGGVRIVVGEDGREASQREHQRMNIVGLLRQATARSSDVRARVEVAALGVQRPKLACTGRTPAASRGP